MKKILFVRHCCLKECLFIVLALVLSLSSCRSKSERYIVDLEKFVNKVEHNSKSYSTEQWDEMDAEFSILTDRYEKLSPKLTDEERRKAGALTARFLKVRMTAVGEDVMDCVKDGLNFFEGFAEEVIKDINDYQNNNNEKGF